MCMKSAARSCRLKHPNSKTRANMPTRNSSTSAIRNNFQHIFEYIAVCDQRDTWALPSGPNIRIDWLTIKAGFVSITSDSMSSTLHMNWRKIFKFCSSASVLSPIHITLTFARQSADLKTIDCH